MLLNRFEKAMMNNPARAAIQRYIEAGRLLRMGGPMQGGRALEVGAGRGVGVEIILDMFGAGQVDAFDLDRDMIALARDRLASRGDRVRLFVGDAAAIDAADDTYDAVFDFGIIHHVPNWHDALSEIARVLKPGGQFYGEEALARLIDHPVARLLLAHPAERRFDHGEFIMGLQEAGLRVIASDHVARLFGWYIARKPPRSH